MQFYQECGAVSHATRVHDISIEAPLIEAVASVLPIGDGDDATTLGSLLSGARANEVLSELIESPSVGALMESAFGVPCRLAEVTLIGGSRGAAADDRTETDHPYGELSGDDWDANLRTRLMAAPLHGGLVFGLADEKPVEFRYRPDDTSGFETKRLGRGVGVYWTGYLERQPLGCGGDEVSGIYLSFNPTFVHRPTGLLRSIPFDLRQVYGVAARRILGIGDRYPKIYPVSAPVNGREVANA